MTLLDFIRYEQQLTGTKIGCREGDCGACSILTGVVKNGRVIYSGATSCLMPLGNARGKHIVTIEGINLSGLNMIQEAFVAQGATQCGFCTPGFIVSLAGYCLDQNEPAYENAIEAVNGNICRCTGYKSIERAIAVIHYTLQQRKGIDAIQYACEKKIVPDYFLGILERLNAIPPAQNPENAPVKKLGGGTDLYVQQHDTIMQEELDFLFDAPHLNDITVHGNVCEMGASTVVTDIAESPVFKKYFPDLKKYIRLVSSAPIRNMATIAGNFTNASPIGDMTIFFLALDARLILSDGKHERMLPLREFYKGYKQLNKAPGEIIEKIQFTLPAESGLFNFEKVCKRTHLDIATVNTAIYLEMKGSEIVSAGLSAGGVGPVPAWLSKSSAFLAGKIVNEALVKELIEMVQEEISPISDVRGTETYKRLLLSQLIKAHFIQLFPSLLVEKIVQD